MADKSEWKTPSMEGKGKGDGHWTPTGVIWTPTGVEPKDYDDDDDQIMQSL